MGLQGLTVHPATVDGAERPGGGFATRGSSQAYKPHIDGLRAISIVAVVAFHAEIAGFGGGFVGVDIFFVISGFLIINQIVDGLGAGGFSILDFYARRALRILPSYGAMLLVTLAGAVLLVRAPVNLEHFAVSALLAPIFLTNIYFFYKSGYFDPGASLKPLLHTWSLAVEEQFYLVVPLLLVGLALVAHRRGWRIGPLLAVAAAAIGIASLVGCILATPPDINPRIAERNPAFFFTWWRAWEFVAGGLIAAAAAPFAGRARAQAFGTIAGLGGLGLLALSISFVGLAWLGAQHGSQGRLLGFPGAVVMLPVAGAMLTIWSGLVAPRGPVARLLSLAPIVYLGQISYALYLWHWPLLVFGRLLPLEAPPGLVNGVAVALAVLLSVATRVWIELPMLAWRRRVRLGSDRRLPLRIFLGSIAACLAAMVVSGAMLALADRNANRNPMLAAVAAATVHPASPCAAGDVEAQAACLAGSGADGFLLGDSHAFVTMPRITFEAEQQGLAILQMATPGCDPIDVMQMREQGAADSYCAPLVQKLDRFLPQLADPGQFAILDGFWNAQFRQVDRDPGIAATRLRAGFGKLMQALAGDGSRRMLVIGPLPSFRQTDPFTCVDLANALGLSLDRCGVPRAVEDAWRRETVAIMKEIVATYPNARFIDPVDLFCDARVCLPVKDGTLAFVDDNHVNAFGAKLLFGTFRDDFQWAFKG